MISFFTMSSEIMEELGVLKAQEAELSKCLSSGCMSVFEPICGKPPTRCYLKLVQLRSDITKKIKEIDSNGKGYTIGEATLRYKRGIR